MGLVGLLAAAAALAIKAYQWIKSRGNGNDVLHSVQMQAAVVGTFARAVFAVLEALSTAKMTWTTYTAPPISRTFGAPGAAFPSPAPLQ